MEKRHIFCQSVWTSPNGKVKVIRTGVEGEEYHCYNLALFQYITQGTTIIGNPEQRIRQRDNKEITEITNVFVGNEWIIKDEKPQKVATEIGVDTGPPSEPPSLKNRGYPQNRAFALSYLKDIVVALISAGIIKEMKEETYDLILKRADKWVDWLNK